MSELAHIPVAFRAGTRLPSEIDDPQAVHCILAPLMRGGEGSAQDIVDVASDPASPIHTAFTWDDQEAGVRQRLMEAFYLAGAIVDTRTGQRVYISRYAETNNPSDIGRIRINMRALPPSSAPEPQRYTVHVRSIEPEREAVTEQPMLVDAPPEVVDRTPDEERSLNVFRRWVEAHRHEPAVLRAALHVLYDAL